MSNTIYDLKIFFHKRRRTATMVTASCQFNRIIWPKMRCGSWRRTSACLFSAQTGISKCAYSQINGKYDKRECSTNKTLPSCMCGREFCSNFIDHVECSRTSITPPNWVSKWTLCQSKVQLNTSWNFKENNI